jgi:hypothetical protein
MQKIALRTDFYATANRDEPLSGANSSTFLKTETAVVWHNRWAGSSLRVPILEQKAITRILDLTVSCCQEPQLQTLHG